MILSSRAAPNQHEIKVHLCKNEFDSMFQNGRDQTFNACLVCLMGEQLLKRVVRVTCLIRFAINKLFNS